MKKIVYTLMAATTLGTLGSTPSQAQPPKGEGKGNEIVGTRLYEPTDHFANRKPKPTKGWEWRYDSSHATRALAVRAARVLKRQGYKTYVEYDPVADSYQLWYLAKVK
jgi:hypothetical protein